MLLCVFVGTAWSQTAELQVSTNETNPENVYFIKNGNNVFMNNETAPVINSGTPGRFAFFAESGENTYTILSVDQNKWLSYTAEIGAGKVSLVDAKADAKAWVITAATAKDRSACYQFLASGSTNCNMNWNGGASAGVKVGFWSQAPNEDLGSAWKLLNTPVSGKYYLQEKRGMFVSLNDLGVDQNATAQNKLATLISAPKAFNITVTQDGKWKIYNDDNAYLGKSPNSPYSDWDSWVDANQSDFEWTVEYTVADGDVYYILQNTTNKYLGADSFTAGSSLYIDKTGDKRLSIKLLPETPKLVRVNYSFVYNGVEKGTQSEVCHVGDAYPDLQVMVPYGLSISKPAGNLPDDGEITKVVEFVKVKELPFRVAADFASIEHWYYLNIRDDDTRTYWKYEDGVNYIKAADNKAAIDSKTDEEKDAYSWAFVGSDPFTGYQIVNKATGASYVLSSPNAPTENKNANQLARMVESTAVGTGNTSWIIKNATYANASDGAFYIEHPTASAYAFNRQDYGTPSVNTLCYWNLRDSGSGICVVGRTAKDDLDIMIAKAQLYTVNQGQIGWYSAAAIATLNEAISAAQTVYDDAEATDEEVTNATAALQTAVNDMVAAKDITYPAKGKFYRLKNAVSGRYMADLGGANVVMSDAQGSLGENRAATIFYVDENNELLAYSAGRYLDCDAKALAAVGTKFSGEFAPAYGGPTANVVTYKNHGYWTFGNRSNGVSIDRGSSNPDAAGYNWTFEEVTWLPVPINEGAGYATIYSPVQLACSAGRVEAYVVAPVSEGSEYVTLNKVDYVPANKGVILKYMSGIENGNVYLQVQANAEEEVASELQGTYAATNMTEAAYVLSKPAGKEVGLYKAAADGATWTNGAFKAYLPSNGLKGRVFLFNFGTETGIEGIEGAEDIPANAVIYDLSGRRVQNAQKGIYIINGKKVIR